MTNSPSGNQTVSVHSRYLGSGGHVGGTPLILGTSGLNQFKVIN